MKKIFGFLIILTSCFSFSQNEKLFYYVEKDSLLGIKNQEGKVIITAKPVWSAESYSDKSEIKSYVFNLDFKDNPFSYYDRKGSFLFKTYMTSEGPDGFHEGFIRYQENNKAGLISAK